MKKIIISCLIATITITAVFCSTISLAQPYSKGTYNTAIPYGDQTSLSISTSGNINIKVLPTSEGTTASGSGNITVISTDVIGYKLYIKALNNTNMSNQGILLPTSANVTPSALETNTWGYNLDASNNFVGISLTDTLIRSVSTPVSTGSVTTITYGVKLDMTKPAGDYSTSVVYTAVPQTD